jgi:DNA-binding GntR family transcriptional regulator
MPGPSMATTAYQHVKQAILTRQYDSGALVTEGEIADRLGISRTPVREALLRLDAEGLITLYPKRGALVLPVSGQEVRDVFETRELVEGFAAARAWKRRHDLVAELEQLTEQMRLGHERRDPVLLMAADRAFHATIVHAGGNQILSSLYESLRDRQMRMGVASLQVSPDRLAAAVSQHAAMLALLRAADGELGEFRRVLVGHVRSAAAQAQAAQQ